MSETKVPRSLEESTRRGSELASLIFVAKQFYHQMITRLAQKVREGYTGWDGEYPLEHLIAEMEEDLGEITQVEKAAIDLACRAMFVYYRKFMRTENGTT